MTPIETLKHEHQVILMVLAAAEQDLQAIKAGGAFNPDRMMKVVDFIRNFADKCHHAKEEDILFVKMHERGMPRNTGPLAAMLTDHNVGRGYVATVVEAIPDAAQGDRAALSALALNLSAYIELLRAHIQKEDFVLYPMAERLLDDADMKVMAAAFDKVESEELGAGTHEKYHQLAHELANG